MSDVTIEHIRICQGLRQMKKNDFRNQRFAAEKAATKRDDSAKVLAAKIIKRLKKEVGGRGIKYTAFSSSHRVIRVPYAPFGRVEIFIEDRCDRTGFVNDLTSPVPNRVRVTAGYGDGLNGTYKLKDGDLSEKQLTRLVQRVKAHVEEKNENHRRSIERERAGNEKMAKVIELVTASGLYVLDPTYSTTRAPHFQYANPTGENSWGFLFNVRDNADDDVQVDTYMIRPIRCKVDQVLAVIEKIRDFEWDIHTLNGED